MKKSVQAILGVVLLVAGVTLIFKYWISVVILFQGVIGISLAIAGLIALYLLDTRRK